MNASAPFASDVDALLPQTQCTRCGYAGCNPYAEALARNETALNRCPPGGAAVIAQLAQLLGRAPLPLDPKCGVEGPPTLAWIDSSACIGCARCLPACPVDAIIGAQRYLHTVVSDWCTGCELCIPACPVDCIQMRPAVPAPVTATATAVAISTSAAAPTAADNRRRFETHRARLRREAEERTAMLAERKRLVRSNR